MSWTYSTTHAVAVRVALYHLAFVTALSIVLLLAGMRAPVSAVTARFAEIGYVAEWPALSLLLQAWPDALQSPWAAAWGLAVVLSNSVLYGAMAATAMVMLRRRLNGRRRAAALLQRVPTVEHVVADTQAGEEADVPGLRFN